MAFLIPRNPTLLESLGQGLQAGLPGLVAGAQGRTRQQDLALLAGVLGQQGQVGGQMGGIQVSQQQVPQQQFPAKPPKTLGFPDEPEWSPDLNQWVNRDVEGLWSRWDPENGQYQPGGVTKSQIEGRTPGLLDRLQPAPPIPQQVGGLPGQPMQSQIGGQGNIASILGQLQSPFGQQLAMGLLQQQIQQRPQPFTLGPGQQRFGPRGMPIAQVPAAQDPFTLGPGQQRFGPRGAPITEAQPFKPPAPRPPLTPSAQQTQRRLDRIDALEAIGDKTPAQQKELASLRRLSALAEKPLQPSQKIAQRRLAEIDRLQTKVDKGTATAADRAKLDKMHAAAAAIEITLGKPPSPSERTAIAETRASIDALNNLKVLFDSAQTKVGPIVGRVAPFKGLLGLTTDEQEDFMAATSAFKNRIIKEITGAQMSEQEANRIMKQIPDITDPPARWRAKWRQSKRNLEFLQKRRAEILRQSGLRVPMDEAVAPPITDPNKVNAIGNKFGF